MMDWLSLPKRERIERFSKKVITKQLNLSNASHQNNTCQPKKDIKNNGEEAPVQDNQVQKRSSGVR